MIYVKRPGDNYRAGYIEFAWDPAKHVPLHPPYFTRVWINCYGEPIPVERTGGASTSTALNCPGAEWAYPKYENDHVWGHPEVEKIIMDNRTLRMMKMGCCPMDFYDSEFWKEYIGK